MGVCAEESGADDHSARKWGCQDPENFFFVFFCEGGVCFASST